MRKGSAKGTKGHKEKMKKGFAKGAKEREEKKGKRQEEDTKQG
ncbi:MAG: hypothetical protein ETSY1_30655 [Candidatus Entotheonella factor]|uniref:Uncharacterized protein n=1 Tax=Entotheonella factor TaxID=1429438 RepID=W4LC10_ENTF1|nr:MAG: hypothetical protein ETSY1_30655 [Candidatus Entotheonella factor]